MARNNVMTTYELGNEFRRLPSDSKAFLESETGGVEREKERERGGDIYEFSI